MGLDLKREGFKNLPKKLDFIHRELTSTRYL